MTQRFQGLHASAQATGQENSDGLYLVRVERARYRWHRQKPFYLLRFIVLEPQEFAGQVITGRLECTAKLLWKLGWFLRDFGYDAERLSRDEVEEAEMQGLCGVIKVSHAIVYGTRLSHFQGFAPASRWPELAEASR